MTNEEYKAIKDYLRQLIKGTSWERKVWLVGGCVRDSLMGNEVNDIDLVLQHSRGGLAFAYWLQSKKLLATLQVFPKFCSSKVILQAFPDQEIDISMTHRNKENPSPETRVLVEHCSLKEDCEARDFTINTLYENLSTGKMRDYTNRGLSDLQEHILRPATTAEKVYGSNPACMLRAIRFVQRFGWPMPPETWEGLQQNAHYIQEARINRIEKEYGKILESPQREACEQMMQDLGILEPVLEFMKLVEKKAEKAERKPKAERAEKPHRKRRSRKKGSSTQDQMRNTAPDIYPNVLVPEKKKKKKHHKRKKKVAKVSVPSDEIK